MFAYKLVLIQACWIPIVEISTLLVVLLGIVSILFSLVKNMPRRRDKYKLDKRGPLINYKKESWASCNSLS